jgi:hypothetical protein
MGLLDRLHRFDSEEHGSVLDAPAVAPELQAKVDAILGTILPWVDPSNTMHVMLLGIARKELAMARDEHLDVVIAGVIGAADRLREYASSLPSVDDEGSGSRASMGA